MIIPSAPELVIPTARVLLDQLWLYGTTYMTIEREKNESLVMHKMATRWPTAGVSEQVGPEGLFWRVYNNAPQLFEEGSKEVPHHYSIPSDTPVLHSKLCFVYIFYYVNTHNLGSTGIYKTHGLANFQLIALQWWIIEKQINLPITKLSLLPICHETDPTHPVAVLIVLKYG